MLKTSKIIILLALIPLGFYLSAGCDSGGGGGGVDLIVSDIQGTSELDENASAQFSVVATGDTGITYAWLCNPPDAGHFSSQAASTCTFNAYEVSTATSVEFRVVVQSDNSDPVVKTGALLIRDVAGMWVGEIIGADEIDENAWAVYNITAGGDSGITYTWSSNMPSIGEFDSPDSDRTQFSVDEVTDDTLVELRVDIESDNFGPVQKTSKVYVRNVMNLWVSEMDGPDEIDEGESDVFTVEAGGDTGIFYFWSCEPSDAGEFATPTSSSTELTVTMVSTNTPIDVKVNVSSSNHPGVVTKVKNITIINAPELIVGEIEGPNYVVEGTSETFTIDASGDAGIAYAWICTPPDAGEFDDPMAGSPGFTAEVVTANTEVELKAIVHSDNFGPVVKTKDITIIDLASEGFAVSWGGLGEDRCNGVAVDPVGNIYATGYFADTVDFDPGSGEASETTNGFFDIFLSKFNNNGELQWVQTWGGIYSDEGRVVAVDPSTGDVYVAGYFNGSVDFDPGPNNDNHNNGGMFLSKFDSSGNHVWAKTWGNSYISDTSNRAHALALDGSGNIYVTGYFIGIVDFDPGIDVDEHGSSPGAYAYVCAYDPDGEYQWAEAWGSTSSVGNAVGRGITIDTAGNAYVTGSFIGITDFDPGPVADIHTTSFDSILGYAVNAYLCKYDSTGEFQWAYDWGGEAYYANGDYGYGIASDGSGNLYVAGYFGDTVDFDPGSGVEEHSATQDVYLSKFTTSGDFDWVRTWGYGTNGLDKGRAVAFGGTGNVYVTGSTGEPYDIFLSAYSSSGGDGFNLTLGGYGKDEGTAVATDNSGCIYVAGYFSGNADLEPGSGITEYDSSGDDDCFLFKVLPNGEW